MYECVCVCVYVCAGHLLHGEGVALLALVEAAVLLEHDHWDAAALGSGRNNERRNKRKGEINAKDQSGEKEGWVSKRHVRGRGLCLIGVGKRGGSIQRGLSDRESRGNRVGENHQPHPHCDHHV